ncbi:MAG: malonyl-CoA decarboxylase domain-containing protein [Acidimicrobiales bacterium]
MTQLDEVIRQTSLALLRLRAETSSQALAEQLIRRYRSLDRTERITYFRFLLDHLGADRAALDDAIAAYRADSGEMSVTELHAASESTRLRLFRSVNTVPHGIDALLQMRTDLIAARGDHPELAPVEQDLIHLLRSWFNRGFLELQRLDWTTPAEVLQKLIDYEAVHEIRGWEDLRRRLADDRRCFGFFHPSLPLEPIIFVEVALTVGMSESIQSLIDSTADNLHPAADTAIFYSITNCQEGLRGISFGSFLIKQVTSALTAELPSIETFATLSPIPGFAAWLASARPKVDTTDEAAMRRSAAHYLLCERRRGLPADRVARFHLRNGARVERLNWRGDLSEKGLAQSHGMLVNYCYSGQDLETNHSSLVEDGVVVASEVVIADAAGDVDLMLCTESPSDVPS